MASYIFVPVCTPGPVLGPYYIDKEECMGDSLQYINANTNYLCCSIDSLSGVLSTKISSLSSAYTSSIPGFAKAWINFNGTTGTANSSYNASVTRTGTGAYTITFPGGTFSNSNYVFVGSVSDDNTNPTSGSGQETWAIYWNSAYTKTTTTLAIKTTWNSPGNGAFADPTQVNMVFYGN